MVQVLNMSTGHYPKGGTSKVAGQVTSLTFDSAGKTLWAGDDKVCKMKTHTHPHIHKDTYTQTGHHELSSPPIYYNCYLIVFKLSLSVKYHEHFVLRFLREFG